VHFGGCLFFPALFHCRNQRTWISHSLITGDVMSVCNLAYIERHINTSATLRRLQYRASWLELQSFWFLGLFGMWPVRISTGTPTILNEGFRGFSQPYQDCRNSTKNRPWHLYSTPFPASHHGGPGSITGHAIWCVWRTEWHLRGGGSLSASVSLTSSYSTAPNSLPTYHLRCMLTASLKNQLFFKLV
jgi:hypothetical protein